MQSRNLWLWLDDERDPTKPPWSDLPFLKGRQVIWCKTYEEATQVTIEQDIICFSLDHDLGTTKNGADFSRWLLERTYDGWRPKRLKLYCHSMNPVGKQAILADFKSIEKLRGE